MSDLIEEMAHDARLARPVVGPYIVTVKRFKDSGRPAVPGGATVKLSEVVSRRAVATLDEARDATVDAIRRLGIEAAVERASFISQRGGTVGPLPDGTVIEVERVSAAGLVAKVAGAVPVVPSLDEIIAAYNAAQEGE